MVSLNRFRATVSGVAGSPAYLTWYFLAAAGTVAQQASAVDVYLTGLKTQIWSGLPILRTGEVVQFDSTTGDTTDVLTVAPQAFTGSAVGDLLPPATQMLVRWKTPFFVAGRRLQGRQNVPYLSSAVASGGRPTGAAVAAVAGFAQALVDQPDTQLVVWGRKSGQVGTVSSASCWTEFSVLRSRRD